MKKVISIIAITLFTLAMTANGKNESNPVSAEALQSLRMSSEIARATLVANNNAVLYSAAAGCTFHMGSTTYTYSWGGGSIATGTSYNAKTGERVYWQTSVGTAQTVCAAANQ